jgi:hypothetical protein
MIPNVKVDIALFLVVLDIGLVLKRFFRHNNSLYLLYPAIYTAVVTLAIKNEIG